ncbi:hypothetical protein BGZ51_003800 [Haplosporangium sp. Z 767]|nr:hypothetical protein BGZ51_003800 [Haplosporangium sp. Z 767]KAF9196209.1 hypothetical protein BGZ50_001610 [Haplosporangium sp. Z 11]
MHLHSSTLAVVFISSIALFSHLTPVAEAHSWADCIDWRFNGKEDWSDKGGYCKGYARRYPVGKEFGSLDHASPSRHYQQDNDDPDRALPCSDRKHGKDKGSDETRADPVSDAYEGKWGQMTTTKVGNTLCVRWPAKNHAEDNEDDTIVQINLSTNKNGEDPTQQELLKNTVAELEYRNCGDHKLPDKRPCGGCFKVPEREPGTYLLQWRWELNPGEWYTSCADVHINKA